MRNDSQNIRKREMKVDAANHRIRFLAENEVNKINLTSTGVRYKCNNDSSLDT